MLSLFHRLEPAVPHQAVRLPDRPNVQAARSTVRMFLATNLQLVPGATRPGADFLRRPDQG